MDYCHACRRHLNGALACAGCGTPVEELRYETPHLPVRPPAEPDHVYELDVVEPPRPADGGRRAARVAARSQAGRGRGAARRGRRSRSRRGRTVLVGTVGLVLAAGTLGLARLALEDPPPSGAATAVEELEVTASPLVPEPVDTTGPPDGEGPSPSADGPGDPTSRPRQVSAGSATGPRGGAGSASGAGATPGPGSGAGSGQGPATGQGGGEAPGQPSSSDSPAGTATPTATPSPGDPAPTGSGTPGGPAPSTTGPTPSGTPTPSPTPTCTRFLWWCV
ncbi:hypothetical protein [Streptomyces sp. NPDC059491]|uniref:SCO2400 family protein n=1 Tax=Streptomyces sp. NPDC059491 TaxID=3346850 RepID=UPI0036BA5C86